jgi:hypothetical protein
MEEARFYYDRRDRRRAFEVRVPTPPPERLVKLCPDGRVRRFHLAAAIQDQQGGYTRIDYENVAERHSA